MRTTVVRNIPDDVIERIDRDAEEQGRSRNAQILQIFREKYPAEPMKPKRKDGK